MRLVIARCTVDYSGRLKAHLPEATRLIMVKADGTLAIHSDGNAIETSQLDDRSQCSGDSRTTGGRFPTRRGKS